MEESIYVSATTLASAIRSKQVSSSEAVDAYLRRIEEVNPRINAVVQVAAASARAQALEADESLARGEIRGPLHGVPFTAKDVIETAGIISAAGLKERATFVPNKDAVVVARMKAAGAILLGKTNCPPGGGGGKTDNPVYGRTNNPFDVKRSPGGSSGGEAAAVAAGMSAVGLGSDSGGSLRVPAHFCGVVTLKPTSGRVPNTGAFNHPGGLSDYRTQIGPLARSVRDLALIFALIAGEDGWDAGVIPMPLRDPEPVVLRSLRAAYYCDDGQFAPIPAIAAAVEQTAQILAGEGLAVEERRPECLGDSLAITQRYWRIGDSTGREIEQVFLDWDHFRSRMLSFMQDFGVILCPAESRVAPVHDEKPEGLFNYALPFSLTGWPGVVVRVGTSQDGMPIGVQIVARPWHEEVALAVGCRLERALGGWQRPPF